MKNVMKKILACMTGLLAAFALASCSDVDTPKSTGTTSDGYVLTGKIVLGSESGATASRLFSSNSSGRTAITSFSGIENLTYTVSALYQDKKTSVTGTVNDMNYSITLTEAGEWFVSVKATKEGSDEAVLSGEAGCYIESDKGDAQNNPITLYPVVNDDVKGSISLSVSCYSSDVTEVAYSGLGLSEYADEKPISISGTATLTDGVCVISKDDVSPASYEVTFYFNDSIGNTLYKCKENVNVFSGLTTDTWFGTSPHMQYDEKSGSYNFVVTDEMIEGFGTELVPDTQMVLYELTGDEPADQHYEYHLVSSADATVSEETKVASSTSSSNNSFCFDAAGNYYVLIKDDSGYSIKSNKFTEAITVPSTITSLSGIMIDTKTNTLYGWYGFQTIYNVYKFANLISSGNGEYETLSEVDFNDEWFYHDSTRLAINDGIVYGWVGSSISGKFYTVDSSETSPKANFINFNYSLFGLSGSESITDMLYQDGAVYLLVRDYSLSGEYRSRGAVIKYDTVFGFTNVIGLADKVDNSVFSDSKLAAYYYSYNGITGVEIEYQLFNDSNCTEPLYVSANTSFEDTYSSPNVTRTIYDSLPLFYTPSPETTTLSTSQFYGPVKFIAVKPKKLIIADDGLAFYTDSDDILKYKNVNRVVTVDLETFSIVTETVNASFETDASGDITCLTPSSDSRYGNALSAYIGSDNKKYDNAGTEYTSSNNVELRISFGN